MNGPNSSFHLHPAPVGWVKRSGPITRQMQRCGGIKDDP
jgi:hypothetical protein